MKRNLLILILALCGSGCSDKSGSIAKGETGKVVSAENTDGQRYLNALEESVRAADRIVVTEHSNAYDVFDEKTQPQSEENYRPIVYGAHQLSADERANFLASIRAMAPKTQDAAAACVFEPHHTIAFFRDGKTTSTLRICFKCGETRWDGNSATPPWSLIPTLKKLVEHVGMHEERDWDALARTVKE